MMHYDKSGIPISLHEWARLFEDPAYQRVARTTIMDAAAPDQVWEVSTVWLGTDHGWGRSELPVIFETMVFAEGSCLDEQCVRYSTLADAEAGHREMVVVVSATVTDPVITEPEETPA